MTKLYKFSTIYSMKDHLFLKFREKIKPFLLEKRQILLGLSGGPDSMVLFHLLRKAKISFSALYIDHGWRQMSKSEAKILKKLCFELNIPFKVKRVENFDFSKGNIEDRLRKERLKFFHEEEVDVLLLGHHQDDQVETVIKRLFEGAKLTKLLGIEEQSDWQEKSVIRPLLDFTKAQILKWASDNEIDYFTDSTNEDEHFLRARMRKSLIPKLETSFGKGIQQNLSDLSKASAELKSYLDRRTEKHFQQYEKEAKIPFLEEDVEMRHLLDRVATRLEITFSKDQITTLIALGRKKESGKRVESKTFNCVYSRNYFCIEKKGFAKNNSLC